MKQRRTHRRSTVRRVSYLMAAFAVVLGFALQEHQIAKAYERDLANARRHAFHELAAGLNELDTNLQKGVYANSPAMLSTLCTQIFGKAMAAQMALGELPYSNIELEQTAAFLAKTGDYASALSRSVVTNGGCTDEQRQALRDLSSVAAALSLQLSSLQSDLSAGAASLDDVRAVQARLASSGQEDGQHLAGSTFQTIEGDFPELPSLVYDGPFSSHITNRAHRMLTDLPVVLQEDARQAAARFLDMNPAVFTFAGSNEGELPVYCFCARLDGGELYVDVTKQGGLVVQIYSSAPHGATVLTQEKAVQKAEEFLLSRGYPHMKESYYINQGGTLTINFASVQDSVICYPDLVKVTIALDTGRVVGFESSGYLMNHMPRDLPAPVISEEQARQTIAPQLSVQAQGIALIPTQGKYEVLCYEFKCEDESGRHILVYVNAQTGQEERIMILLEDENGTLAI